MFALPVRARTGNPGKEPAMVDQTTNVGSLDELVTTHVAAFIQLGVDSLNKVSLIEAAWSHPEVARTAVEFADLIGSLSPETVERDLEKLATSRLFDAKQSPSGSRVYGLTSAPERREAIGRVLELLADPSFRARAVAQLHYAGT
jgi:hypothetical protein